VETSRRSKDAARGRMSGGWRTRGVAALLLLVGIGLAVYDGWELNDVSKGGGTLGTYTVKLCDMHRVHRPGHFHYRTRVEFRCQGSFRARGASADQAQSGVRVETPQDHAAGEQFTLEHGPDGLYQPPREYKPVNYVGGFGVAALLVAGGLFGVLTGYTLGRGDSLRAAARSLPAPKVLGPVLGVVGVVGLLTAVIAGFMK
jgi:hypothetical protein